MQNQHSSTLQSPQLWFSRVSDATLDIEKSVLGILGASEIKRLNSIKSNKRHREFLLSRSLMRHALSQYLQQPESEWIFADQSNTGPVVLNKPSNIHLSLSHSGGHICFALAKCEIGIDLEVINKTRDFPALARAFMSRKEIDDLPGEGKPRADYFYRIWCAKEALFKATPSPQQASLSMKNLNYSTFHEERPDWHLIEDKTDQYRLAIVTKTRTEKTTNHYFPNKAACVTA